MDVVTSATQQAIEQADTALLIVILRGAIVHNVRSDGITPTEALHEIALRLKRAEMWFLPVLLMGAALGAVAMACIFIVGSLYTP